VRASFPFVFALPLALTSCPARLSDRTISGGDSADGSVPSGACAVGSRISCHCADGSQSTQTCTEAGALTPCECGPGSASGGTGGASGSGGASFAGADGSSAWDGSSSGAAAGAPDAGMTGTVPDGDTCGRDEYGAEVRPLDMFIMMDRSGSMVIPFGSIWTPVAAAIGTFVTLPEAAGMGVGINFFPLEPDQCNVGAYATPAVGIAPLPQNGPAIQGALQANGPTFGETPTLPAMQGAIQYAQAWAASNPGRKTIVVLATDGEPNACNPDVPGVAAVAAQGAAAGIDTYVIGIGNLVGVNQIAMAGNTGQALVVSTDPAQSSQQFLAAMNQIRGAAVPCDYGIPAAARDDPSKVNLDFTPGGQQAQRVPNVVDAGGCQPGASGWYYDDPSAPQRIFTCPDTCNAFKSATRGRVNVIVGCPTLTIQ